MSTYSKFFTGKSHSAFKMNGKGRYVATWKSNETGLLFLSYYDKNGIYEPTASREVDYHNNADMFEYLEKNGFTFVD